MYVQIASIAYARSNLHEVSAVTAVHYLLHGTTFVSSHDFQTLHLGCHLSDINKGASFLKILKSEDSYILFRVTENYTLRQVELKNECSQDFTEKYYITSNIPKH